MPERSINFIPASLRELLQRDHPELGAAVQAVIEQVCVTHVAEVRAQIASAAPLDDDNARDDLAEVLATLARVYLHAGNVPALALCGPAHAWARGGQNFTPEELFAEYMLLRRNLRRKVRTQLQRALREDEEDALQLGLDSIVATTAISFNARREAGLKLECSALSDFLASLAHDVRNEINGVMTSVELLEETSADAIRAAGAGDAELAQRMDELVRDASACRATMESSVNAMTLLLEAERLRTAVTPRIRRVALLPLMQGVVRSAGRNLRGSKPRGAHALDLIKVSCPEGLIVSTDPDLLGTALINLVGNAVKHAPGGDILFTAIAPEGRRCRLEVRDHGPGIPAEQLEKLFGRFERGDTRASGAGLGLYIAHRAAELLGSAIVVTSEPGQGSTFALELPSCPPAAPPAPA